MAYKAIGFDYGGVLAGEPGPEFAANVAKMLGIDINTYRTAYFKFNKQVNRNEISWPELWRLFLEDLGHVDRYEELMHMSNAYHARLRSVKPEMLRLVDRLRAHGYKLGLLSNNTISMAKHIEIEGIASHFDVVHVSAVTQFVKPEVRAFSFFAEKLGVITEDLIFIDDSEKSLSTAQEAGYTPILFQQYDQLLTELSRLGVEYQ
jgi:putative hydrolase of the HAD superfamily